MHLEFAGTAQTAAGAVQGNGTLTLEEVTAAEAPPASKGPMEEVAHVGIGPVHNVLVFSPDNGGVRPPSTTAGTSSSSSSRRAES